MDRSRNFVLVRGCPLHKRRIRMEISLRRESRRSSKGTENFRCHGDPRSVPIEELDVSGGTTRVGESTESYGKSKICK